MRSNDFLIRALRSHSTVTLAIWLAKSIAFPKRILIFSLVEFRCRNTDEIRSLREFQFLWNSGQKSRFQADSLTQSPSFWGSLDELLLGTIFTQKCQTIKWIQKYSDNTEPQKEGLGTKNTHTIQYSFKPNLSRKQTMRDWWRRKFKGCWNQV